MSFAQNVLIENEVRPRSVWVLVFFPDHSCINTISDAVTVKGSTTEFHKQGSECYVGSLDTMMMKFEDR